MLDEVANVPTLADRAAMPRADSLVTALLWGQGFYYLATGMWPLVDIDTFEKVTGPKTEHWLVMTVGVLVASIALPLLVAAYRRQSSPEIALLAIGSALGLSAIDIIFVAQRVIAPIYLADAAVELILIGAWIVALTRSRPS